MANILNKRVEWLHRVDETNPIYLDLSRQVQALGSTDILAGGTISSATAALTTLKGDDTANPLTASAVSVVGTGDKLSEVLRVTLSAGVANTDKKIVFEVTWSSGAVLKYEGVIRVR